jgi:hypothetical protein
VGTTETQVNDGTIESAIAKLIQPEEPEQKLRTLITRKRIKMSPSKSPKSQKKTTKARTRKILKKSTKRVRPLSYTPSRLTARKSR